MMCTALLFKRSSTLVRLIGGATLLIGYQLLLDAFWLSDVLNSARGGLYGSLSWAALLLLCTVGADLFFQGKRAYALFVGLGAALAVTSAVAWAMCRKGTVVSL